MAAGVAIPLTLCNSDTRKEGLTIDTPAFGDTIQGYYYMANSDSRLVRLTASLSDKYSQEEIVWEKISGSEGSDKIFVSSDGSITWGEYFLEEGNDFTFSVKAYLKNHTHIYDTMDFNFKLTDSYIGIITQFGTDVNIFSSFGAASNDINTLRFKADFSALRPESNLLMDEPQPETIWSISNVNPSNLSSKLTFDSANNTLSWKPVNKYEFSSEPYEIKFDVSTSLVSNPSYTFTKTYTISFGNPIPYPQKEGGQFDYPWFDIDDNGIITGTNNSWNLIQLYYQRYDTLLIPSHVKGIAPTAFQNKIPDEVKVDSKTTVKLNIKIVFGAGSQCTTIGTDAFCKNGGIKGTTVFPKNLYVDLNDHTTGSWFRESGLETADFSRSNNLFCIPQNAFERSGLSNIIFPKYLTRIHELAFEFCTKLTSITLPKTYQDCCLSNGYNYFPFYKCINITSFDISKCENPSILPFDCECLNDDAYGIQQVLCSDGSTLDIKYDKTFKYCLGWPKIGTGTKTIDSLILDTRVQIVTQKAFYRNYSGDGTTSEHIINKLDLSSCTNLKEIWEGAFFLQNLANGCVLPNSITNISAEGLGSLNISSIDLSFLNNIDTYNFCSFYSTNENGYTITLPSHIKRLTCKLPSKDFVGNSDNNYPQYLKSISGWENCTELEYVDFGGNWYTNKFSDTDWTNKVDFSNCHKLKEVVGHPTAAALATGTNDLIKYDASYKVCFGFIGYGHGLIDCAIDSRTELISDSFFGSKDFNVPNREYIKSIDFSGAVNLKKICGGMCTFDYAKGEAQHYTNNPCLVYWNPPYYSTYYLARWVDDVDGNGVLYDSSHTICFGVCPYYKIPTSINILPSTKFIVGNSFNYIPSVPFELSLPDGLKQIGDYAFDNCQQLTGQVNIPDSVEYIGNNAFSGCTKLSGSIHISNNKNCTTIGNSAFANSPGLSGKLTIPDNIQEIGDRAFYSLNKLSLFELSKKSKLERIGDYAFYNCTSLTGALEFNSNFSYIGEYSFYNCLNIDGINLKDCSNLTKISTCCFMNCSHLYNINLPNSIKTLGDLCFANVITNEINLPWTKQQIDNDEIIGLNNLPNINYNAVIFIDSSMTKQDYLDLLVKTYDIESYSYVTVLWRTTN